MGVKVNMVCNAGHSETWSNCSRVGEGKNSVPLINITMIYYIFVTGLHYDRMKEFFEHCSIPFISATTFYSMKRKFLYPVIWSYWQIHQDATLSELKVSSVSHEYSL